MAKVHSLLDAIKVLGYDHELVEAYKDTERRYDDDNKFTLYAALNVICEAYGRGRYVPKYKTIPMCEYEKLGGIDRLLWTVYKDKFAFKLDGFDMTQFPLGYATSEDAQRCASIFSDYWLPYFFG